MAKIEFLGPLGRPSIEVDISNLQELKNYFKDDAEMRAYCLKCNIPFEEDGELSEPKAAN